MELWDARNREGKIVGRDLIRGEKIPDGLYHMVCEVLVRHVDGDFLLMQRDFSKPNYPGLYEATAGGSALKGEDEYACVRRELWEETGIQCDVFQLFDVIVSEQKHSIYYQFYCETACDKQSVRLQEGETISFRWVDKNMLRAMLNSGEIVPVTKERMGKCLEEIYGV